MFDYTIECNYITFNKIRVSGCESFPRKSGSFHREGSTDRRTIYG